MNIDLVEKPKLGKEKRKAWHERLKQGADWPAVVRELHLTHELASHCSVRKEGFKEDTLELCLSSRDAKHFSHNAVLELKEQITKLSGYDFMVVVSIIYS